MTTGPQSAAECTHWIGAEQRHCHDTDRVRPYLQGLRCPAHTPAALAGKPEPEPGPGITRTPRTES